MFNDWTEALEAESLPLDPTSTQQLAAAARATARRSHDKDDMALLLDVLGLPTDETTLTALLPLIPETGDAPTMTNTPDPALSAHEAMAISMHNNGDTEQVICQATGLSKTELGDLIAEQVLGLPGEAADAPDIKPVTPAASADFQELLAWATAHPAASVRNRAARITADLSELTDRRDSEAAQREAEDKVAKAKAELESAQEHLRNVKTGTRATTAPATAPTPIRAGLGSGRTREELAAIRTWARANGHQVADAGMIAKSILAAYDAAHQTPVRKAG
ncbi:histone-like nucleoid-structuring protein Lsr2 [Streptomyces sp. NPDC046925]|uniref:Lsr2 family DNA-binding protein n=1 Tax=Streptomyces sp. NPDC046925 TaxID=3155375 RepID=UPI0033E092CD